MQVFPTVPSPTTTHFMGLPVDIVSVLSVPVPIAVYCLCAVGKIRWKMNVFASLIQLIKFYSRQ